MSRVITPGLLGALCERCWQRPGACICAEVPRLSPRTEIIILRHVKEQFRPSNTARIAELALSNLEILEVGGLGADRGAFEERLGAILRRPGEARLLFPTSTTTVRGGDAAWPARLIVPDGTWRQARRIMRRVPGIAALPRWSLPVSDPDKTRLRRPPRAQAERLAGQMDPASAASAASQGDAECQVVGMSTIEAIAAALSLLEGEAVGGPLVALYDRMVERLVPHQRRRDKRRAHPAEVEEVIGTPDADGPRDPEGHSSVASGPAASNPIAFRVAVPVTGS